MKLCTINPFYTSLFSVIIFAALTSSISVYSYNGRTYINSKYEVAYGGSKTLKVDGIKFEKLKSYRKLTVGEQSKLQKIREIREKKWKQREKEERMLEAKKEKERKSTKKWNNNDVVWNENNAGKNEKDIRKYVVLEEQTMQPNMKRKMYKGKPAEI